MHVYMVIKQKPDKGAVILTQMPMVPCDLPHAFGVIEYISPVSVTQLTDKDLLFQVVTEEVPNKENDIMHSYHNKRISLSHHIM